MKVIVVDWCDVKIADAQLKQSPARRRRRYVSKIRLADHANHFVSFPLQLPNTNALAYKTMTPAGRKLVESIEVNGVIGAAIRSYVILVDVHEHFEWDGEDQIHSSIRDAFRVAAGLAFPGRPVRVDFAGPDGVHDNQFDEDILPDAGVALTEAAELVRAELRGDFSPGQ